ncbi:unnamed protein product [Phaedon cochleariae]|nr:unnamed protein product [Phaedon cochleariae]
MTRLDQLARPRRRPDLPALAEHAHALPPRPLSSSRVSSSMSHLAGGLSRSVSHLVSDMPRATRSSQLREQKLSAATGCSEASSRPSSSLSQQSTNSVASSASVRHRMSAAPRKPRPVSIAVTGVTHDLRNDTAKPPLPRARRVIGKAGERTEKSDKAVEKSDKASEKSDKPGEKREKGDRVGERNEKERVAAAPRPKVKSPVDVASKAGENAGQVVSKDETQQKPPDIAPVISQVNEQNLEENGKLEESITDAGANIKDDPNKENVPESKKSDIELVSESRVVDKVEIVEDNMREGIKEESREMERQVVTKIDTAEIKSEEKREGIKSEEPPQTLPVSLPNTNEVSNGENIETSENIESNSVNEMTASMTKIRITTEEEAKAALAERRRLIREEAERQAEMERLRIEAEAKAEIERQQREEEQVRHLIELQRQTEQERLQEAIRETQKREEEERLRREEEQRLKVLKEESDRKAKEEAEKQKAELQEKLKNEEKEREARRKRVEAIMLRTRGKNNANLPSQQSTDDKNNENKSDENKDNDSKVNGTKIVEQQENGTTNSSEDADIVDNIIPSEIVKNANTVTIETMNSSDSLNSNNSWRGSQQYGNFVCNNNS